MSLLGERERDAVASLWEHLAHDVGVRLDVGPVATPVALLAAGGREIDTNAEARALVEELCALSDRVTLELFEHEEAGAYPSLTVGAGLRYVGLPWGYELASVVQAVAVAGADGPALSEPSLERLAAIDRPVSIDVFVTPT